MQKHTTQTANGSRWGSACVLVLLNRDGQGTLGSEKCGVHEVERLAERAGVGYTFISPLPSLRTTCSPLCMARRALQGICGGRGRRPPLPHSHRLGKYAEKCGVFSNSAPAARKKGGVVWRDVPRESCGQLPSLAIHGACEHRLCSLLARSSLDEPKKDATETPYPLKPPMLDSRSLRADFVTSVHRTPRSLEGIVHWNLGRGFTCDVGMAFSEHNHAGKEKT